MNEITKTINVHGVTEYRNAHGAYHRLDGPAIIRRDGSQSWYKDGDLHREDGPALIYMHGEEHWFYNGARHRIDGPAVTYSNGDMDYWIDGKKYSYEDWLIKTNPTATELFIF